MSETVWNTSGTEVLG